MPGVRHFDAAALLGPEARRSPEMETLWQKLWAIQAGQPDWLDLDPVAARALQARVFAYWNIDLPAVDSVTALRLPGGPSGIEAELLVPEAAHPGCLLFLHGGGWAFGNVQSHGRFARLLANATRSPVLAIDYRLAPEHPYPEPLDDCRAAWAWLVEESYRDPILAGPLGIAGDSAGANLALAVTLDCIARGLRKPDLALLFYGVFSSDLDSPAYRRFAEGYGLTRAGMTRFWDWYVPPERAVLRADPLVSPVEASDAALAALPPLFLNAAGLDPLLSDTLTLVDRLRDVGAVHDFVVHEGVHHGFMQMSSQLAEAGDAFNLAADFFRQHRQ